jgi:hypothetical protein
MARDLRGGIHIIAQKTSGNILPQAATSILIKTADSNSKKLVQ